MATEAKFREDPDLAFLQHCDFQDLKLLSNTLISDSAGTEQWTGGLKSTLVKNMSMYPTEDDLYKNSWKAIAAEIQLFGGDTVVNLIRGKGVVYRELLEDVARKTGVDFHKHTSDINILEEKLLRTLFGRITQLNELNLIHKVLKEKGYLGLTSIKESPIETIKNSLGGGTASGAAGGLFAGLNMAKNFIKVNPLVAAATLPLTAKDITAPAYRVTIPATCIIAMMRIKHEKNKNDYNEF
nr:DUF3944 domain-containing protein [Acinetobacter tandoii]